ncbi:RidA family protein [Rhodoferax ferrireducens]|uniref:RidA family protein n=1 Tax=Rhodoferax ferrireducens TaxID=192843 RepID=UPI001E4ED46E|nr:RidA family protein [Rhodoferax ferrireducens]
MNALSLEEFLVQHGLELPPAPHARGAYAPFCEVALGTKHVVFVSGQTCRIGGKALQGISEGVENLEEARNAARVAMLNCLAALRMAAGGVLSPSCQVVRLRGFIRSGSNFTGHTAVLDAASELLQIVFPGHPLPARTAVGVSSLPDSAWIEIELDAVIALPA